MNRLKILLIPALILITGCHLLKDLATITFTTTITKEFPVVINAPGAFSADTFYSSDTGTPLSFSYTTEIKLEENFDIEPYLKKIKEIDLSSVKITVRGMNEGQIINQVTLSIQGFGDILSASNITATNNFYSPQISTNLLNEIADKFVKEKKIFATIYGSTNGPISVILEVAMDARIVAYVLD